MTEQEQEYKEVMIPVQIVTTTATGLPIVIDTEVPGLILDPKATVKIEVSND